MAVSATPASADTLTRGSSDGDVLFESKLERVRAPRDVLARPRLTDVLQEAAPTLVLLAAPPGFGKTTVLAQWRDLDSRAFACVSLDSGDNDPVALWSYIVQAIRNAATDCDDALTELGRPRPDIIQTVVPALLNDLEGVGEDLVLVLDDYQEITNRICHDSLVFFLERAPRNVTVALSTRIGPADPTGEAACARRAGRGPRRRPLLYAGRGSRFPQRDVAAGPGGREPEGALRAHGGLACRRGPRGIVARTGT